MRTFVAEDADAGERLDRVVAARLPDLTRRVARSLCRRGSVRLDGRRAVAATRLEAGQRVEVSLHSAAPREAPALRVLELRDEFVFVDKPASLHTVRLRPSDPTTLADQVAARFPECALASGRRNEAGALHRLDGGTSGVVAFARNAQAHSLGRQRLQHSLKLYVAVCRTVSEGSRAYVDEFAAAPPMLPAPWRPDGTGPAMRIQAPLAGHGPRGSAVRIDPGGLAATSLVWDLGPAAVEGVLARWTLVQLLTGRRHQARVHLAHIGRPVLSDAAYAGEFEAPHRPLLHAWALALGEPVSAAPTLGAGSTRGVVCAPVPPDFPVVGAAPEP